MEVIAEQIQCLELKLLQADLITQPELIDELLAENFEEIDGGEIRSRADVIGWLERKDPNIQWTFKDFRIKALSDDLVLAIYSLQKPDQSSISNAASIRTSIWQYQNNQWKMLFHQASRKS